MARLSRQTRENIKIGAVLALAALLLFLFVIYPLNRSKALMIRSDFDQFTLDTLPPNMPSPFAEAGLLVDTSRLESDGLTRLACLYLRAASPLSTVRGTVIVIPDDRQTRDAVLSLARLLTDSGFVVITYDQRASGRSSGAYHGGGELEALDLEAVIADFELHNRIPHPLIVVGFAAGADAALLARPEGRKIDGIVAVNPHLTTDNLLDRLFAQHGTYWFPFRATVFWWWYNIRSSSAASYRELDALTAVPSQTVLLIDPTHTQDPAVLKLAAASGQELLSVRPVTASDSDVMTGVLSLLAPKP